MDGSNLCAIRNKKSLLTQVTSSPDRLATRAMAVSQRCEMHYKQFKFIFNRLRESWLLWEIYTVWLRSYCQFPKRKFGIVYGPYPLDPLCSVRVSSLSLSLSIVKAMAAIKGEAKKFATRARHLLIPQWMLPTWSCIHYQLSQHSGQDTVCALDKSSNFLFSAMKNYY